MKRFRPSTKALVGYFQGMSATDMNLAQMSKPALVAKVLAQHGQINELRGEILKQQIVAATRLDVIRLLGFMMNRNPAPDPMIIAPKEPEVKRIVAAELVDLAKHLRERAVEMDKAATKLAEDFEDEDAEESS